MQHSITHPRVGLVVDIDKGYVLDAPPETTASVRWAESHPFVEYHPGFDTLAAGPHASHVPPVREEGARALQRATCPPDAVFYDAIRDDAGNLRLTRIA